MSNSNNASVHSFDHTKEIVMVDKNAEKVTNGIPMSESFEEKKPMTLAFKEYVYNTEQNEKEMNIKLNFLKAENKRKDENLKFSKEELETQRVCSKKDLKNMENKYQTELEQTNRKYDQEKSETQRLKNVIQSLKQERKNAEQKGGYDDTSIVTSQLYSEIIELKKKLQASESEREKLQEENENNRAMINLMKQKEIQHMYNMKTAQAECKRIMDLNRASDESRSELKKQNEQLKLENVRLQSELSRAVELKTLLTEKFESAIEEKNKEGKTIPIHEENEKLKKAYGEISNELQIAKKKENALITNLSQLEKTIQDKDEKITKLSKEVSEGRSREENFEAQILEFKKRQVRLQNENEIENELKKLQIVSQSNENRLTADKAKITEELKEARTQIKNYQIQAEKDTKKISELQSMCDEINKTLNKEREMFPKEKAEITSKLKDMSRSNHEFQIHNKNQFLRIRKLQSDVESKKSEYEKCLQEKREYTEKCKNMETKITLLEEELNEIGKEKNKAITEMNNKFNDTKSSHEKEIGNHKLYCQQLTEKIKHLQSSLGVSKNKESKCRKSMIALQNENDIFKREINSQKQQLEETFKLLDSTQSQSSQLMNDNYNTFQKYTEMESLIKQLRKENEDLTVVLKEKSQEKRDLTEKLECNEKIHVKNIDMIFHLQSALSKLENELTSSKVAVQLKDETIENLRTEISSLKGNSDEIGRKLKTCSAANEKLEKTILSMKSQHEKCKSKNVNDCKKNKKMLEKITELEKYKSKIEMKYFSEIEKLKTVESSYMQNISDLENTIKVINNEKTDFMRSLQAKTDEYDKLSINFQNLCDDAKANEIKMNKISTQLECLQNDSPVLSAKLAEYENEIAEKHQEIESLKKELLEKEFKEREHRKEEHFLKNIVQEQQNKIKIGENKIRELLETEKKLINKNRSLSEEITDLKTQLSYHGKDYENKREELNALKGYVQEVQGVLEGNQQKNKWVSEMDREKLNEIQQLKKLLSDHQTILLQDKEKIIKLEFEREKFHESLIAKDKQLQKIRESYKILRIQFNELYRSQSEKSQSNGKALVNLKQKEKKFAVENDELKKLQFELSQELNEMKTALQYYKLENSNCWRALDVYKHKEQNEDQNRKILEEKTIQLHREYVKSINVCKSLKIQNTSLAMMLEEGGNERENYETSVKNFRIENNSLRKKLEKYQKDQKLLQEQYEDLEKQLKTLAFHNAIKGDFPNRRNRIHEQNKPKSKTYNQLNLNANEVTQNRRTGVTYSDIMKLASIVQDYKKTMINNHDPTLCTSLYRDHSVTVFPPCRKIEDTKRNRKEKFTKVVKELRPDPENVFDKWRQSYHTLLQEMNELSSQLSK